MRCLRAFLIGIAVVSSLAGPLRAAEDTDARRITPEEVQRRREAGEKPLILDTRREQADAVVRGAVHVPNDRLAAWAKDVPKGAFIVTYCT